MSPDQAKQLSPAAAVANYEYLEKLRTQYLRAATRVTEAQVAIMKLHNVSELKKTKVIA